MKHQVILYLFILLLTLAVPLRADTLEVMLGNESFHLELVADPQSRTQGLMGRSLLEPGTGMLFDFPAGSKPAIWMRNMQMALDLLFIDDRGRLAQVFAHVPPCPAMPCDIYQADRPLRFVMEVAPGTAERLGLQPGDELDLGGQQLLPAPQE